MLFSPLWEGSKEIEEGCVVFFPSFYTSIIMLMYIKWVEWYKIFTIIFTISKFLRFFHIFNFFQIWKLDCDERTKDIVLFQKLFASVFVLTIVATFQYYYNSIRKHFVFCSGLYLHINQKMNTFGCENMAELVKCDFFDEYNFASFTMFYTRHSFNHVA